MSPSHPTIWTVGHSTLEWPAFLAELGAAGIEMLVDVRSFPGSRRYPHFGREAMGKALPQSGIAYRWMPDLGGRRKAKKDSRNTAWRSEAFRGYADYMETPAFAEALEELESLAKTTPLAYMCSEAVWWRCHRGLISDALKSRGWRVVHLMGEKSAEHPYTPAARFENGALTYAGDQPSLFTGEKR